MNERLQEESERLVRSWKRHDPSWLAEYLVAGVEDPRVNVQSVLMRHFLLRACFGEQFAQLMEQELRFSAVMSWLLKLVQRESGPEEFECIHYALQRGADNAEGLEIPRLVLQAFGELPRGCHGLTIPNYIERFLSEPEVSRLPQALEPHLNTFQELWSQFLSPARVAPVRGSSSLPPTQTLSVLEPACGSANDYRFLNAYGIAPWLDYTGIDLCEKNILNALALFPRAHFVVGNVFEIDAADKAFDFCIVQDLLEHLSLEGMQTAVKELCRVARCGLCVGFFQMDEIRDHLVRPVEEYHFNLLSMTRMRELFAQQGFAAQVVHIDTFVRQQIGWESTHNANAYTFLLQAQA